MYIGALSFILTAELKCPTLLNKGAKIVLCDYTSEMLSVCFLSIKGSDEVTRIVMMALTATCASFTSPTSFLLLAVEQSRSSKNLIEVIDYAGDAAADST